jgi:hypothetical protein
MKHRLMMSVLMVAAAGAASADPVTSDDLLKGAGQPQGMADLQARLPQLAL